MQARPRPELGGFRVVREIGRGGMGVVYEAIEKALGRRVALKVLPFAAAIDPRQIARFRVEAQAASQLNHPHIVPVYSVGCHGGVHFYAMQLVDGPTLADLIAGLRDQAGPAGAAATASGAGATWTLTATSTATRDRAFFREVARLGRQAAEALDHAHQQGVLHRDVKPSNLMVDARGQLWVTDFGLARFQGEASLTAPGDVLGTLRYMSPEQAASDRVSVDARTDVYSLGATLYELTTLRPVYEGNNRQELLRRIALEEPRRPRAVRPEVPRDLETIVLKAMAKDAAARYRTAQELADDLGRFLDDRPILAHPVGPLERLARWARRHAAALLVAVPLLAAIAIALGVAFGLVLSKQAEIVARRREVERAHIDASRQRDEARRAVDEMYTQFAAMLGRQPDLQLIQRDFLLKALKYYEAYATERDPDPAVRARAGVAAFRVGEIQRTLGNPADAERAYRQAIAVLESIPRRPGDRFLLEVLGRSHGSLGQLLTDLGRKDEARPALACAVELTREYVGSPDATAAGRALLAAADHRLGLWLRLLGRHAEAQEAYRKTIELASTVGGTHGREMQAGVQGNLGDLLALSGRPDEAERAFRDSVATYRSLVNGDPGVPVYRQELARALDRLGGAGGGPARRPRRGRPAAGRGVGAVRPARGRFARRADVPPRAGRDPARAGRRPGEVRPPARRPAAGRARGEGGQRVDRTGRSRRRRRRPPPPAAAGTRPAGQRPARRRPRGRRRGRAQAGHRAPRGAGRRWPSGVRRRPRRDRLGLFATGVDPGGAGRPGRARSALRKGAERQPVASIAAADLARSAELAARDRSLPESDRARQVRDDALRRSSGCDARSRPATTRPRRTSSPGC